MMCACNAPQTITILITIFWIYTPQCKFQYEMKWALILPLKALKNKKIPNTMADCNNHACGNRGPQMQATSLFTATLTFAGYHAHNFARKICVGNRKIFSNATCYKLWQKSLVNDTH